MPSNSDSVTSFARYLTSKRTVDDRALNRFVWHELASTLPKRPLRVLEIGCGVGTMIERTVEWGLLGDADYTALDAQGDLIHKAGQRLYQWGLERGYDVVQDTVTRLHISDPNLKLAVHLLTADLDDFLNSASAGSWDLLIAHAFLDLVDLKTTLPRLIPLLVPGGVYYFTLNFDGVTALVPEVDPILDHQIEDLYHRTMDERLRQGKPSGDRHTGRHLLAMLPDLGTQILAAGASDWVVHPQGHAYPADEAYFLRCIMATVQDALQDHPDLDAEQFGHWLSVRNTQIDRSVLIYIAHQLDILGRRLQ